MTVYLIADYDAEGQVHPSFYALLAAAQSLTANDIIAVVLGHCVSQVADQLATLVGVDQVLVVDHPHLAHHLPEQEAPIVAKWLGKADYVFAATTSRGKDLMPQIAARCGVPQVSAVIKIEDAHTFVHPVYAGNIIETVRYPTSCTVCCTIRPSAFPTEVSHKSTPAPIKTLSVDVPCPSVQWRGITSPPAERPALDRADIVLAGGRGVGGSSGFDQLMAVADRLGAGVGATRAVVDAGVVPYEWQVGQTGQVVAPRLYFAIGISGAIQHVAGIKDSQVIVAINKDPDAPIFKLANYGLVADFTRFLPEWEQSLTKMGY